jgi:polysaccharide biosynthesis transport protein
MDPQDNLIRREPLWEEPLALPPGPQPPQWSRRLKETHLLDYLMVLRRHMWLSLAFLLTVVTVVTIASFKMRPVYIATAQVEIEREGQNGMPFQGSGQDYYLWEDMDSYIATQAKIFASDTLALETIKSLELWKYPEFKSDPRAIVNAATSDPSNPEKKPAILGAFLGRLTVKRTPGSHLLEVSFESEDPTLAAKVVNATLQNFIDTDYRTKYEEATRASDWLSKQLDGMKIKVEKSEDNRIAYERQNQIWNIGKEEDITTAKLAQLNKELTEAQADRMKAEANDAMVRAGNLSALPQVQGSSLIQDLVRKQADLKQKYTEALQQFGPKYPKVERLRAQLDEISRSIQGQEMLAAKQVETIYEAALKREQLLEGALSEQKKVVNDEAQRMIQYNILQREAEANKQLYYGLLGKLKEATLSAGMRTSNLRVVDPAMVPSFPSRPQKARNIALAFMVGLVGGIGLAFLREYLDNTVKTPDDIEYLGNLPSLAVVPALVALNGRAGVSTRLLKAGEKALEKKNKEDGRVELVSFERPQSPIAEAFRALRTSLLLSRAENPPQVILVTSALPKEGKTTAAVNLAATLAQLGDRTILLDADMRKPGIGKLLGLQNGRQTGLSTYLAGVAPIEQCIHPSPLGPGLTVLPAGPIPPSPADLLSSQRLVDGIAALRRDYKFIVVDSPPIMLATDAVILSSWADGVLLVVRSGATPKGAFTRTRDLLAGVKCRVLGVILNAVDTGAPDYYYSYRYYPYQHGSYGGSAEGSAGADVEED